MFGGWVQAAGFTLLQRLNEGELRDLVALAEKRTQTKGELIRGLIQRELKLPQAFAHDALAARD